MSRRAGVGGALGAVILLLGGCAFETASTAPPAGRKINMDKKN